MSFLWDGLLEALNRIVHLDPDLIGALLTTLQVSIGSTLVASFFALPLGFFLAMRRFHGKPLVLAGLRTALAAPTVVVALLVYSFVARHAPLGSLGILFTPTAIVIGQVLLILPLLVALTHGALEPSTRTVYEEALLLGASPPAAFWKAILEAGGGVTTAVMTGFGRVVSEIGISLILGGNIRGFTRTMTTAIALETNQGDFAQAIALGVLLLCIVLTLNLVIQLVGRHPDAV